MAPEDSKMYHAKVLKLLLDTVSQNDIEDRNVEVKVTFRILEWAM